MALSAKRRWLFRIATLLATTLAALVLGEVALRIFWGGYYMDEGSLRGRRSELLGWESRPGLRFTVGRPEFHHEASHDTNGFRTGPGPGPDDPPRETPREKPAGKARVLCLGDSFTWGYGVGDAEAFPARLAALDPRIDAINAGCMGYGTQQEYLLLRERGLAFSPDVVVLAFFWNDLENVLTTPLGFSTDERGGLVEAPRSLTATATGAAAPGFPAASDHAGSGPGARDGDRWEERSVVTRALRHSYVYRFGKDAMKMLKFRIDVARGRPIEEGGLLSPAEAERAWRLVSGFLAAMRDACKARGVRLLVVGIPDQKTVHPEWPVFGMTDTMLEAPARFVARAKELGIDALDLTPGLVDAAKAEAAKPAASGGGAKLFYPRDRHLTPAGHDVAGRLILAELRRLG